MVFKRKSYKRKSYKRKSYKRRIHKGGLTSECIKDCTKCNEQKDCNKRANYCAWTPPNIIDIKLKKKKNELMKVEKFFWKQSYLPVELRDEDELIEYNVNYKRLQREYWELLDKKEKGYPCNPINFSKDDPLLLDYGGILNWISKFSTYKVYSKAVDQRIEEYEKMYENHPDPKPPRSFKQTKLSFDKFYSLKKEHDKIKNQTISENQEDMAKQYKKEKEEEDKKKEDRVDWNEAKKMSLKSGNPVPEEYAKIKKQREDATIHHKLAKEKVKELDRNRKGWNLLAPATMQQQARLKPTETNVKQMEVKKEDIKPGASGSLDTLEQGLKKDPWIFLGGKKKKKSKRKSQKRKSQKRKSQKRKSQKRKSQKRKSQKRKKRSQKRR